MKSRHVLLLLLTLCLGVVGALLLGTGNADEQIERRDRSKVHEVERGAELTGQQEPHPDSTRRGDTEGAHAEPLTAPQHRIEILGRDSERLLLDFEMSLLGASGARRQVVHGKRGLAEVRGLPAGDYVIRRIGSSCGLFTEMSVPIVLPSEEPVRIKLDWLSVLVRLQDPTGEPCLEARAHIVRDHRSIEGSATLLPGPRTLSLPAIRAGQDGLIALGLGGDGARQFYFVAQGSAWHLQRLPTGRPDPVTVITLRPGGSVEVELEQGTDRAQQRLVLADPSARLDHPADPTAEIALPPAGDLVISGVPTGALVVGLRSPGQPQRKDEASTRELFVPAADRIRVVLGFVDADGTQVFVSGHVIVPTAWGGRDVHVLVAGASDDSRSRGVSRKTSLATIGTDRPLPFALSQSIPAGRYVVRVQPFGHTVRTNFSPSNSTVGIRIPDPALATVHVLGEDARPVAPPVDVKWTSLRLGEESVVWKSARSSDGAYRIRAPAGDVTIRVATKKHLPKTTVHTLPAGHSTLNVRLERAASVKIEFLSRGKPTSGKGRRVVIRRNNTSRSFSVNADPFNIHGLEPGIVEVESGWVGVSKPSTAATAVTLVGGETTHHQIELEAE